MKKNVKYKITIGILVLIIILEAVFIVISRPKRIAKAPGPAVKIKGKIAIVIDDWGYNLKNLPIIDQIHYSLTASVLPNLNYSSRVAGELHRRGFQIILHLPMQPHEPYRLEKNTIMVNMDEQTIKNILARDLANLVFAKGVSNHMGSKATEDKRVMGIIFREIKRRHLYFLDSFVSSKSVCPDLAPQFGIRFLERDVFLDNKEEYDYIVSQLYKLKRKAGLYGQAIGIGHDRRITLEVLRDLLPQLEKEGYKFVFLSELVNPVRKDFSKGTGLSNGVK